MLIHEAVFVNTMATINSRAYTVVKRFIDEGRPLDEEALFNHAFIAYQKGKHRSPARIRDNLRKSIILLTENK